MRILTKWRFQSAWRLYVLNLILMLLVLSSCKDDDPGEITLNISVTNGALPANDFTVTLYNSLEDWASGTNPVVSMITDGEGKVTIGEGLSSVAYYADVFSGNTTNWNVNSKLPVLIENQQNDVQISVTSSVLNFMIGKAEKSWVIIDAEIDGFSIFPDLDECEKDDVLFFQRDSQAGFEELGNVLCDGEVLGRALFDWSLNANESVLTINEQTGSQQVFEIKRITDKQMELITELNIEGIDIDVLFRLDPAD